MAQENEAARNSRLKLLIADDDQPTRMLLRAAISQWGYEIIEASNGEEAWQTLQSPNPPSLLILDWLMPKLDGIELCKQIRQKNTTPYYPYIILLTQMKGVENIINGLDAGANEFLSKPFNMAELRSRLSTGSQIIQHELALQQITSLITTADKDILELINTSKNQPCNSSHLNKIHLQLENIFNHCNQFKSIKKKSDL